MTILRAALWAIVMLLWGSACSEEAAQPSAPADAAASQAPIGDPAGPRQRRVAQIANPYTGDRDAIGEGERLYRDMNCADCHGYSGTGNMGPSLVDAEWLFGDSPFDRFSSVKLGRARGMPAYGHLLPDEVIWKIIAYIDGLEQKSAESGRAAGKEAKATDEQAPTRRPR